MEAQEGPQTLRTIAEDGLPEQYLEQLLGALRRGGRLLGLNPVQETLEDFFTRVQLAAVSERETE